MTLGDAFTAYCCPLSMRILRRFLRANDNGGWVA